jgi:hypothetical protein
MKRALASTSTRTFGPATDAMVAMVDWLSEAAMKFLHEVDDPCVGRYIVEVRQDGSLLSMRAMAEPLEVDEQRPDEPTLSALTAMYEQIVPSAEAYFAEAGERPPLMADMYDRFVKAGFAMDMVERVTEPRLLQ